MQCVSQTAFRQFDLETVLALRFGASQRRFGGLAVVRLICGLANQCGFGLGRSPGLGADAAQLGELIREAAGEPTMRPLSAACVYTIVHPDKLRRIWEEEDGIGVLTEGKRWTGAVALWYNAQSSGEVLPVVFADATDCSKLIYWGLLNSITIDGDETQCAFTNLQRIPGSHSPHQLILTNTGERIAPGFIRPYALVETPKFLR
jgi:hypothetical protein